MTDHGVADTVDDQRPKGEAARPHRHADRPLTGGRIDTWRLERPLGYKTPKYIKRIELAESLAHIADGKGGYWEHRGYQWYAGI